MYYAALFIRIFFFASSGAKKMLGMCEYAWYSNNKLKTRRQLNPIIASTSSAAALKLVLFRVQLIRKLTSEI